ncbi:efflux transporter, outer membrane factor lipoprotein, NodT family [Opitutaceae bacterium TAV1]|nr:efflux transporter, outer membrane factor lipoprotein, NodT family [Opitutaceae bacterium TAV1]
MTETRHPSAACVRYLPPLAVAALLGLSSCASTADRRDAATASIAGAVPGQWQHASASPAATGTPAAAPLDTSALVAWWTRFNDPVLDQLVTEALKTSPDLRTALSKIEESRARRGVEKANLFPTLSGSVSGREDYNRNHNTGTSTRGDSYAAGLDASWEIDLFGRQRRTLDAATADLAQTEENYHAARVSLVAEVAAAYVSLRSAEEQLAVVEETLATRTETTQIAQWREQAGTGSALDTQQAISTLEQARAALPLLRQTISQTRNQLALLSGLVPGALDTLLAQSRPVPAVPAGIAIGIPADTLRQRPDVRAAERGLEAAIARTGAAERQRLPSLNLSGSLGVEALKAGRLFSPDTTIGSLIGSLSAPLFDAGNIRQQIRIQSALEEQALIGYESTVLTALSEVEDALVAVQRTAERLEILDKATAAAAEAASLAELQYKAGTVDLGTVLDAQRTLLGLREQQVSTTADRTAAHIQLYKSLGGGWEQNAEG